MHKIYDFAGSDTQEVARRVAVGQSMTVVGVAGAGIALFMKHLAGALPGFTVLVEVSVLPKLTAEEFFTALATKLGCVGSGTDPIQACRLRLEELVQTNDKVVLLVAGIDRLQPEFSTQFFHSLRSLRAVDSNKIVFVFGSCNHLKSLLPPDLINTDLSLFASTYYLKPYSAEDMRWLLNKYGPVVDEPEAEISHLIWLSGGHFQFLQLLLGSESRGDPVQDPFIQLAFKNIFMHLSTTQKAIVRKLAIDGTYPKADDYLTNIGIVKKQDDKHELFSALFADCVRKFGAPKLPVKERRLLAILKRNEGRIVPKRDIFDEVWRGQEIGSEWALNALMYRLRKHPAFIAQNYTIESHKKSGYVLIKDF